MTSPSASTDAGDGGRRALWQGRTVALLAILFIALNLRTAISALSAIIGQIEVDIRLGSIGVGLLGMLPPICFAVVGLFAPRLHRRFGLQPVVIAALVAMLLGHLLRAASTGFLWLALASTLTFAGMGLANVLLPPLVKAYFPDRIGLVTSLYATIMAVGATIPPLIAVPVAEAAGWRISVGLWSLFVVLALVPMVTLAIRDGARGRAAARATAAALAGMTADDDVAAGEQHPEPVRGRVARSPLAWSLMAVFSLTSMNAYAMFAWLPEIVADLADASPTQAGTLLSLYAAVGLPASLLVPILAVRLRSVAPLVVAGVVFYLLGYGGLLVAPGALTWLWVAFAGFGPLLFPLCLVLINLRTRSHDGAVALSSFVQSIGYAGGALGPLLVGVLHEVSGGWMLPLLFLVVTALAVLATALPAVRPVQLEDQWLR